VATVGALVAVGGGGSVPQEVSRRGKISHCNVRVFIIVNLLVIVAERYASIAAKPGRFSLVGNGLISDKKTNKNDKRESRIEKVTNVTD